MGISKKEFLEEYYVDEIPVIMEKYADLNKIETNGEQEVGAEEF